MEEKKKIETPDAETLKMWLDKAVADNKQLYAQLQQVTDTLNILPYLFKVIELKEDFGYDLREKSVEAIKNILFAEEEKI